MTRAPVPGLRVGALFSEAGRNLSSGTSRGVLLAALLGVLLIASCLLDLTATAGILSQQRAFRDAGGDVQTVNAPGRISADRCLALRESPGVTAVIALRITDTTTPVAALPATAPPLLEAAGDLPALLGTTQQTHPGLYLDADLAATLDATAGDTIPLRSGTASLVGTYAWPSDGRSPVLSGASIAPVPTAELFDQCWARIWPANPILTTALLSTVTTENADTAQPPTLAQLNSRLGPADDTAQLLQDRPTALLRGGTLIGALLLGIASARARRVEIAMNRAAGASRTETSLQLAIETLAWAGVASLLAAATTLAVTLRSIDVTDRTVVYLDQVETIALALAVILTGAVGGALTLRTRSLYRYAKDR